MNNKTIGYGNQCVQDISVGVDSAVWALSCDSDGNGNFNIIKWDPFLTQWYLVKGKTGVKIAAYNEISAAVLTANGLIYVSSDTGDSQPATYIARSQNQLSLYTNSTILVTQAQREWLKSQLPQYGVSALLYRATIHGWSSSTYHNLVDNQGPTLSLIKSSTNRVFGYYISGNMTSANAWYSDPNAFIFQLDNLVKLPIKSATDSYAFIGH